MRISIVSPNGVSALVSLNDIATMEVSLPMQEEWLFQAIRAAARRAGLEPDSILVRQIMPFPSTSVVSHKPQSISLEDLGL